MCVCSSFNPYLLFNSSFVSFFFIYEYLNLLICPCEESSDHLVDCPTHLICIGCLFVFHDKTKRTQQKTALSLFSISYLRKRISQSSWLDYTAGKSASDHIVTLFFLQSFHQLALVMLLAQMHNSHRDFVAKMVHCRLVHRVLCIVEQDQTLHWEILYSVA